MVDVEFEVAGFEGYEGENGGDFVGTGDLVFVHGGDEEGGCLDVGCAFGGERGAIAGVGFRGDFEDLVSGRVGLSGGEMVGHEGRLGDCRGAGQAAEQHDNEGFGQHCWCFFVWFVC